MQGQSNKREVLGYGRINLAKKSGKPYFSLTMMDQYGNKVYHNGFINNLIEAYINPVTMGVVCYVEEIFRKGTFGSSGSRKIETVRYVLDDSTGTVIREILDGPIPEGSIRTILMPIKTGDDARFPHITFYKNDDQGGYGTQDQQQEDPAQYPDSGSSHSNYNADTPSGEDPF